MAFGIGAVVPAWAYLAGFACAFFGVLGWRLMVGRRKPGYLAVVEYWIYSNALRIPPTEAVLDQLVSKNPHNRPGRSAITAREGILMSDIRLQVAIAKREKNPHAFRPDLFDEFAEPSAEVLDRLARCSTLAKAKFVSQVPLSDRRHVQFVTHLASTLARMLKSELIFDTVSERFWLVEELEAELERSNDAERPDLHVRVVWQETTDGCSARSLGLRKVGLQDIRSGLQDRDHEVIVTDILHHAACRLFAKGAEGLPLEYAAHDDVFEVSPESSSDGLLTVRLVRKRLAERGKQGL